MQKFVTATTGLLFWLSILFMPAAFARLPTEINGQKLPSLADMLEKITPAVVNIHAEGSKVIYDPADTDPRLRDFFGHHKRKKKTRGTGSGIIVNADEGYILTNAHVVDGSQSILVTLNDQREFKAQLVGADSEADIAVLKIPGRKLTALRMANSDKVRVGDFVVAIGNPYGLGQSVSSGIVSALGRSNLGIEKYENFIQTDAPINPGNSGGALINLRGELIGINTAILGGAGGGNVGIGFAIPANMATSIMKQLVRYGNVQRGQLGIIVEDLTPRFAQELKVNVSKGAVIERILRGSAAEKAGLNAGDIITKINNRSVKNSGDVRNMVGNLRIASQVNLEVHRNGRTLKMTATLGNRTDTRNFHDQLPPIWRR